MKKTVRQSLVLSMVLLFSIMPTIANAYVLYGSQYLPYTTRNLIWTYAQGGSIDHSNQIATAITRWNNSGVKITAQKGVASSYNIWIDSKYAPMYSWGGLCAYPQAGQSNQAIITINDYHIPSSSPLAINAVLHEVGHAYGLDHNSNSNTLMYPNMQTSVLYPTQDDINGVNVRYP